MRTRTLLPLLAAVILLAGCRRGPSLADLKDYDRRAARELLVAALDAWKQGKVADLSRRTPPVRFVDEDHAAGAVLVAYELADDADVRPFVTVPVKLSLRDRRGQTRQVEAGYQVTLEPRLAVLRADP